MWGSYWWDGRDVRGARGDVAARVVRHLAAAGAGVPFLDRGCSREAARHLAQVVEHSFSHHPGEEDWQRLDRALLELRIAPWQGALAGATMRLWPTVSPFLWEGALGPLQPMGLQGTMTWQFEPSASGSVVTWRYMVHGHLPGGFEALAPSVGGVIEAQLNRLGAYLQASRATPPD